MVQLLGGVFVRAKDGVDARKLIAKICDGGRVTSGDARTATGTDVVGFAVHPLRDEFWAIVDSADGALGIGEAGEWSPVALAANHLGTDAYWYRAYTPELALAVVFPRGGTWLRAYAGTADDIVARLDSDGVPVRTSPPPSAAGARALLATVAYEPGKYATGPDAKLAAKLHAVHDALVAGEGERLAAAVEACGHDALPLALGIVRGADRGKWAACLQARARALLAAAPRVREPVQRMTLDEEVLRRAGELADSDTALAPLLDHLDAIEADAERRSAHSHPGGVGLLADALQKRGAMAGAFACSLRLVRRPEPSWVHCNYVLFALLQRAPELVLDADAREAIRHVEQRLPELGQEAIDAITYNLGCVYARAGQLEPALAALRRCRTPTKQNAHPEQDTDLKLLWTHPGFRAWLGGPGPALETPVDELELSVSASQAVAELGVATIGELIASEGAKQLPARVRGELRALLADEYDITWGEPVEQPTCEVPGEHAVARHRIVFEDRVDAEGALIDRLGGKPNAPSADFAWPSGSSRPMRFIGQLVGKAAGGAVDLGDIHVLQIYADLDGEFYESTDHAVVAHRAPCPAVVEPPATVEVASVRAMLLEPGVEDRRLLDDDAFDDEAEHGDFDAEAAQTHAWCDKVGGVAVGANFDKDLRNSKGEPMQLVLELLTYDDWFLWALFADAGFRELQLQVVRG
jgi:hypothetical protein